MPEQREVRFATDWAFEPVGVQEIRERFRAIDPQMQVRYDSGPRALIVRGPISAGHESEFQTIYDAFVREHRDDLFDPRVTFSPARPHSTVSSTPSRDTCAGHLMDEPMSEPSSQGQPQGPTSKIWTPSNETHAYYVSDQLSIMFRVSVKTGATIDREVQSGRVRFRISALDRGAVEEAWRRLDDLEATMTLAAQPHRSTVIVGPEGPDVRYSITKRDISNRSQIPAAFFRLLLPQGSDVDPSQVGLLVLSHLDGVTGRHSLPDDIVNPPVIRRTEADTIEAWKDYVFPGLGDCRSFGGSAPSKSFDFRQFSVAAQPPDQPVPAVKMRNGGSGTDTGKGHSLYQRSTYQRGTDFSTASASASIHSAASSTLSDLSSRAFHLPKRSEVVPRIAPASKSQAPGIKSRKVLGSSEAATFEQEVNEAASGFRSRKRELPPTDDPSRSVRSVSLHSSRTAFLPLTIPAVISLPPPRPTQTYLRQIAPIAASTGSMSSAQRRKPPGVKTRKVLGGGEAQPSSLARATSSPPHVESHLAETTRDVEYKQSTFRTSEDPEPHVSSSVLLPRITELSLHRSSDAVRQEKRREKASTLHRNTKSTATMRTPFHEAVAHRIQSALTACRKFPGHVSLEVQIGLVTVEALPANMWDLPLTLKQVQQFVNETEHNGAAASTCFANRVTTSPADVDHIVKIQNNGHSVFEREPAQRGTCFEFHCEMRTGESVVIEIDSQGEMSATSPRIMLDNVNICFPGFIWDAAVILHGKRTPNAEMDTDSWATARALARLLYIEPGQRRLHLRSLIVNGLKVEEVIVKRTTLHQLCHDNAATKYEDTCLQITEKQSLHLMIDQEDPNMFHAWYDPLSEMTSPNRQWWEVSLVSPALDAVLETNQSLQPGETSDVWSSADILGTPLPSEDGSLADSGQPGGRTTSSSSSSNAAADDTEFCGIGGLLHLTEVLVRNMGGVGGYNNTSGEVIAACIPRTDPEDSIPLVVSEGHGSWKPHLEEREDAQDFW